MIVTIDGVNRQTRTGDKGDYESLGLVVLEEKLMDINGDEFSRDERWLSGYGKKGVTDSWSKGDKVKVNIVRKKVTKDGVEKEYLNFRLPEGVSPVVSSEPSQPVVQAQAIDPTDDF